MPKWNCLIPLWNVSGFLKGKSSGRLKMRMCKYVTKSRMRNLVFHDLEVMPTAASNTPASNGLFPSGWEESLSLSGRGCPLLFWASFQVHDISERLPSVLRHLAGAACDIFPLVTVDQCAGASQVMGKTSSPACFPSRCPGFFSLESSSVTSQTLKSETPLKFQEECPFPGEVLWLCL